jgi:uncharacterized protein YndB with AHSA1/START domain
MAEQKSSSDSHSQASNLAVRKIIQATPEKLFTAWTQPEQLKRWWGPASVICVDAEVDLRIGGRYRIGNKLPDGTILWITGEFQVIEPPHKLVYTWRIGPESQPAELVTVFFESRPAGATEVIVVHERIPDKTARDTHEQGWVGCLDGLAKYLS